MREIRLAKPHEVDEILRIAREGFPPELICYTILGCIGVNNYYEDIILNHNLNGTIVMVSTDNDIITGFAEFRCNYSGIFLNHIYVSSECRGKGIGNTLLLEGIKGIRKKYHSHISLDVFADNDTALKWYENLGFDRCYSQVWSRTELSRSDPGDEADYYVSGMPQANIVHRSYGFSQFDLAYPNGTYQIGRLGLNWFRTTNSELLNDKSAIDALISIDNTRELLCIAEQDKPLSAVTNHTSFLAESIRCKADINSVIDRLS